MNKKMKPITNPMLIGAMELVKKNKSPENLKVFMDELLHAKMISPIVITPPPAVDENGKAKLTPENKISVPMLPGPEGKKYFMAFTDMDEIKKMKTNGPVNILGFGFREYAAMIAQAEDKCDGLVINPGSGGPIVNKAMVAAIMKSVLKKDQKPAEETAEEMVEEQPGVQSDEAQIAEE